MPLGSPRPSRLAAAALAVSVSALAPGCVTVFSDVQGARLVGKGRVELTPSASAVWPGDDPSDHVDSSGIDQLQAGLQAAAGVSDKLDLRLRYERVWPVLDEAKAAHVLGFGPKVGLIKDRAALYVPVGFAFGGEIEASRTWQAQPTLLFTLPAHRGVDLNASTKLIVPFDDEAETLAALNLGLGLGNPERFVVRPELGFLWNPGEPGHYTRFTLGVSFRPRR